MRSYDLKIGREEFAQQRAFLERTLDTLERGRPVTIDPASKDVLAGLQSLCDEIADQDAQAQRAEWEQLADSRIMATCDDCVMGPKDGGCTFCGYESFDDFCKRMRG